MRLIDEYLNKITMYRLLVYGLSALAVVSMVFSLTGAVGWPFAALMTSLVVLLATCYATNRALASVWEVPVNAESWLVTALIMYFVLAPATTLPKVIFVMLAGVAAMASKYLVARRGAHIFNPAAFGVAVVGLTGLLPSAWWVGSSALWPFSLVLGLLVVRKIRRTYVFATFAFTAAVIGLAVTMQDGNSLAQGLKFVLLQSPLIFLGSIMLTEPSTMPPRQHQRIAFAALVAVLYASHPKFGGLRMTPELALLFGNVYTLAVANYRRVKLMLLRIETVTPSVKTYVFKPDTALQYLPGQYMEWTMRLLRSDDRGNRRTFTIASSPTEPEIMLGVKFYDPSSAFKSQLKATQPAATLHAGLVAGNFTLPAEAEKKLAFVAGGIGVTPFRSMVKYLVDTKQHRDIVLVYLVSHPSELAYKDIFESAAGLGVRFVPVLSADAEKAKSLGWTGETGFFDGAMAKRLVSDFAERRFYISGPNKMVDGARTTLRTLGVKSSSIVTDHFSGY